MVAVAFMEDALLIASTQRTMLMLKRQPALETMTDGLNRLARGACRARGGQLKLAPAEIATAMIMAASQSTVTQNGGHQRVLAT